MISPLYIASRTPESLGGFWSPVGRLEHDGDFFRFVYTKGAKSLNGFEPFPGMPDLGAVYESAELFPLFANRLLSRSRPEYEAHLTWSGFDPARPPDPLAILGLTQGLRETDRLEVFPCPVPDADGRYRVKFFVHGVRWMNPFALGRVQQLQRGEILRLLLEVGNPYDPYAVQLQTAERIGRTPIGYLPRYLARDIRTLVEHCRAEAIQVTVEQLNQGAPYQQKVLCQFSSCWPDQFVPCSSEPYESIPDIPPVAACASNSLNPRAQRE